MRNKRQLLPVAIGSIVAAVRHHGAAKLWIVDNDSTDGSFEFVRDAYPADSTLLTCPTGVTIGEVRNVGALRGSAPVIVFLDCDCHVAPVHLLEVENVFAERPEAVAVGCKIALPQTPTWVEKTWNDLHDDGGNGPRSYINSANLAVRRPAFAAVGGFSERLETGEDSELCQRFRDAGGVVYQDQRLSVMHLDNAKTLGAFYAKERWRGLGMFGTVSMSSVDKPTAMMFAHLLLMATAGWLVLAHPLLPLATGVLAVACLSAVPAVSVAYRRKYARLAPGWLGSILLYECYFLARINALAILAWRSVVARAASRR